MKLHHGLLSISDFAAYCGTTRQTLQYYDRIGLLKPIQLGEQGYRYYHPLQSHEVRMIRSFQGSGSSLEEVKEILNFSSLDALDDWVSLKQEDFAQELIRSNGRWNSCPATGRSWVSHETIRWMCPRFFPSANRSGFM